MKNTGIEYEVLVQSIFKEIHNEESTKNITIKRDIKLTGKSGITHQIDIFWEFELGGITYSTIVQAKDWKSSVKQEQILALKSVLDDLPKQPRGIVVTKKGFQKGAEGFAKSHGIELFVLKEMPELAFEINISVGSLIEIKPNFEEGCIEIQIYPVKYLNINYVIKNSWMKRKFKNLSQEVISESLRTLPNWNQNLYKSVNAGFQPIETIGEIIISTIKPFEDEIKLKLKNALIYNIKLSHDFNKPTFFPTKSRFLPFIRIESISFNVEVTKDTVIKSPLTKQGITTFVLKNIIDGRERNFEISNYKQH